jgi:hypothetical protein
MRTRPADRSTSLTAQGLTKVAVGTRASAQDLLAARALLRRLRQDQARNIPRSSRCLGAPAEAAGDERVVERYRALLGCAVRGISPPDDS